MKGRLLDTKQYVTTIFVAIPIVLGVIFFLLAAILNHQQGLAVFLFLILGTVFIAKIWSRVAYRNLKIDIRLDTMAVFPDETVTIRIIIINQKLLPVWVRTEVPGNIDHFFSYDPVSRNHSLLGYQQAEFEWDLKALRRGCCDLGDFRISVADPLGLFPVTMDYRESLEILIYPKMVLTRSGGMPKGLFFGAPGEKSPILDPVYVLGTRDYRGISSARLIHWKTSARYHKLQEKICEPSVQEKILIVVDVKQFEDFKAEDEFERTLEVVSSMAVQFEKAGKAVGFITNSRIRKNRPGFVSMGRSDRNLALILETMAAMSMECAKSIREVFYEKIGRVWGISCIFCSLEINESVLEMASFYSKKRIPVQYYVSRIPRDHSMIPSAGTIHLLDDVRL